MFCVVLQATESYLVHEGPHRAPGISECFLVPESYRVQAIFLFLSVLLLFIFFFFFYKTTVTG